MFFFLFSFWRVRFLLLLLPRFGWGWGSWLISSLMAHGSCYNCWARGLGSAVHRFPPCFLRALPFLLIVVCCAVS
jgi:hypothetical protein